MTAPVGAEFLSDIDGWNLGVAVVVIGCLLGSAGMFYAFVASLFDNACVFFCMLLSTKCQRSAKRVVHCCRRFK
jgi:hypothetical protein